jgi:small subunit ribosomal protein S13
MARISGIDLSDNKRVDVALTYIYGIGRNNVMILLQKAKIKFETRVKELSEEDIGRIQKIIDTDFKVEGDLHTEVIENIKRLKEIGCYRGVRHAKNLPVRGQRTRVNARTKRGKRQTVGALKKETRAKLTQAGVGKPEAEGSSKK